MSKCFVINEWLLHDLKGDNGQEAQKEAYSFLTKLVDKCDRIAILRQSPWMDKAYELMKVNTLPVRTLSKFLHLQILRNSAKCLVVTRKETRNFLEEVIIKKIPEDDLYLIDTFCLAKADIIITSDTRLQESLKDTKIARSLKVTLRNDFLNEYLNE